jgi:hypothetical protein
MDGIQTTIRSASSLQTSKQQGATRIKPNQGKSSQIKLPFFINPQPHPTTTTIMIHMLMKGKER